MNLVLNKHENTFYQLITTMKVLDRGKLHEAFDFPEQHFHKVLASFRVLLKYQKPSFRLAGMHQPSQHSYLDCLKNLRLHPVTDADNNLLLQMIKLVGCCLEARLEERFCKTVALENL
jgi:hypothetical protein